MSKSEQANQVLVKPGSRTNKCYHLPKPESDEPLCGHGVDSDSLVAKSRNQVPTFGLCGRCERSLKSRDEQ